MGAPWLAKYNLTPVASILVNGEHFRRPILVILKIPKMEKSWLCEFVGDYYVGNIFIFTLPIWIALRNQTYSVKQVHVV